MYDSLTPVVSDTPFSPVHNALKFASLDKFLCTTNKVYKTGITVAVT